MNTMNTKNEINIRTHVYKIRKSGVHGVDCVDFITVSRDAGVNTTFLSSVHGVDCVELKLKI